MGRLVTMEAVQIPPEKMTLGRLKSFGMRSLDQVPLLLPKGYDDLRVVARSFEWLVEGEKVAVVGRLAGAPNVTLQGTPRMTGYLVDAQGFRIGFTFFGDTRELQKEFHQRSGELVMLGTVKLLGDTLWLSNPEIIEAGWVGRVRPDYPGIHRVINADTARERMSRLLPDAIPMAGRSVWSVLCGSVVAMRLASTLLREWVGGPLTEAEQIEHLLRTAHWPSNPEDGVQAQGRLERLAALSIWVRMEQNRGPGVPSRWAKVSSLQQRAAALPFMLSESQKAAVRAVRVDLRSGRPMRRLISGDVGTGKSAVLGLAMVSVLDAGGRVFLIAPSQTLAEQLHNEFLQWWPDLTLHTTLAVGGRSHGAAASRLVVGTTALLHGDFGQADLVVVDEQHKFSVAQREQLVGTGCHLLEATATCIPRTQALAKYGVLDVSVLTSRVEKDIKTRIWHGGQRAELWKEVLATMKAGHQVLVIYPTRSDDAEKDDLPSAEAAAARWERSAPGRVGLAHAGRSEAENTEVLRRMREGSLLVLVSTVLVEVGINIPGLRRVVVMHAERFGLTQLHQIRGRAARHGGEGWFDLVLPRKVGEDSQARLSVLERVTDGFEVAQEDLRLRGFGDLGAASARQTGSDGTFLFGRGVNVSYMDEMLERIADSNSVPD